MENAACLPGIGGGAGALALGVAGDGSTPPVLRPLRSCSV